MQKTMAKILFHLGPILSIAVVVMILADRYYRQPFFNAYLAAHFLILLALWIAMLWIFRLFFAFPLPRGFYLRTAAAWTITAVLGWLLSHLALSAFLAGQGGRTRLYVFGLLITWLMGLAMIFIWQAGLSLAQRIFVLNQFPLVRTILLVCFGLGAMILVVVLGVNGAIRRRYQPLIYSIDDAPAAPVAIVFGAGVYEESERPSLVLRHRLETAAHLVAEGKAAQVLLSGDGSPDSVEVDVMARYAISVGIPEDALILDREGFRTRATCERAYEAFGFRQAVLVTQVFHLPRALFLCDEVGLEAVGVAADRERYSPFSRISWTVRESAATAVAWLEMKVEK